MFSNLKFKKRVMKKENSILLAIRHQLSVLGYSEQEINDQDESILYFAGLLVKSIPGHDESKFKVINITHAADYIYYMHINDPKFSEWEHDALMSTFESNADWERAIDNKDLGACQAIVLEVEKFCQSNRVPHAVFNFVNKLSKKIKQSDSNIWNALTDSFYIVDAYCDEDKDEYVDGVTGK